MYGSHQYGTVHKSAIPRKKSKAPAWRLSDKQQHPVTVRRVAR